MRKYLAEFYRDCEFPALIAQMEHWRKTLPFKGLKILDATPVFRNTMTKYMVLLAGGADLTVAAASDFPHDEAVLRLLPDFGVQVMTPDETLQSEFDVVMDCAGRFNGVKSRFGYVELTRSGLYHYENCRQPVFFADAGRIKEIETVLGTGDGFLRAMDKLGLKSGLNGGKVVIFGYGKVGRGVAMYVKNAGGNVIIVDEPTKVKVADGMTLISRFEAKAIEQAVRQAYCVVSVTGCRDAWCGMFDPTELAASETLIVNMGVEDEFGAQVPTERVLNKKQPLNFILPEPTQLRYIEATMALHNAGALALLKQQCRNGINLPPVELEQEILQISAQHGLIAKEMELLEL